MYHTVDINHNDFIIFCILANYFAVTHVLFFHRWDLIFYYLFSLTFNIIITLISLIIHLLYPEYSARVRSVIPSMTSKSEHRRSRSLSGWFSHPVCCPLWFSNVPSVQVYVCICFVSECSGLGLQFALNDFSFLVLFLFFHLHLLLLFPSPCLSHVCNTFFSFIIRFSEHHHQTNQQMISFCMYYVFFLIAFVPFKVGELSHLWSRKNPPVE